MRDKIIVLILFFVGICTGLTIESILDKRSSAWEEGYNYRLEEEELVLRTDNSQNRNIFIVPSLFEMKQ